MWNCRTKLGVSGNTGKDREVTSQSHCLPRFLRGSAPPMKNWYGNRSPSQLFDHLFGCTVGVDADHAREIREGFERLPERSGLSLKWNAS